MSQFLFLNDSDSDILQIQKINSNFDSISLFESRLTKGLIDLPQVESGDTPVASSVAWGKITGDLPDQVDLDEQLALRLETSNVLTTAQINNITVF